MQAPSWALPLLPRDTASIVPSLPWTPSPDSYEENTTAPAPDSTDRRSSVSLQTSCCFFPSDEGFVPLLILPSPPEKAEDKRGDKPATLLPLIRRVHGVEEAVFRKVLEGFWISYLHTHSVDPDCCVIYPNVSPCAAQQSAFTIRSHSSCIHSRT